MTMNETLNTVTDLTTKGSESLNSLNELNMSLYDRLATKQMNALNVLMDQGNRTMTMALAAKGLNDLMRGQIEVAKSFSDWLMAETKDNLAMVNQAHNDYQSWYQQQMEDLRVDLRKAVPAL